MKPLIEAIEDYLALRRSLGFKLRSAGAALMNFAAFMEQHQAGSITVRLALAWAQQPRDTQPALWAQRLSFVRGFGLGMRNDRTNDGVGVPVGAEQTAFTAASDDMQYERHLQLLGELPEGVIER